MNTFQPDNGVAIQRDRRFKATLAIGVVWGAVSLLHWRPETQVFVAGLTGVLGIQTLRMLTAKPNRASHFCRGETFGEPNHQSKSTISNPNASPSDYLPKVSILVPAKNESAVLPDIARSLFQLDYPSTHLDIWIVDDGSTDETPEILRKLQAQFPGLQVHSRTSKGGKSGALNAVFPFTQGEIVLVCDADALLPAEFLRETVPLFQNSAIGAVQVRKAIANADTNFLTRCQHMELLCGCFLQTHRLAVAGMTELWGNGMLVRREVLEKCNGWSEDTVTDDLDLSFKLHLADSKIEFVAAPPIQEEGVIKWIQLWHQRCRWVEGGYQRYLDYFPQILTLGWEKKIDLLLFFLLQFLLPVGLLPDLLWTTFYSHHPVLLPLQTLLSIILSVGFIVGLYQFQGLRGWQLLWATIQASVYMVHWIPAMIVTTMRLCVKSPTLEWVKTEHRGRTL